MHKYCVIEDILKAGTPCSKDQNRLERRGVRGSDKKYHKGEEITEDYCPWHIDSEEYLCCFWIYILTENNKKEHNLIQIANLSPTR